MHNVRARIEQRAGCLPIRSTWLVLRLMFVACLGSLPKTVVGEEFSFATPSDDRWHYPFNFTPATRPVASLFSSVGNLIWPSFNDRDGILIAAWNTSTQIEPGLCAAHYRIKSIRVTLTNQSAAVWPIDTTPDEWFTLDFNNDGEINADGVPRGSPGDVDGESDDSDSGRTIELFGVGFGPVHSYSTWTESSFYVGGNDTVNHARDPYPFVFQEETGNRLHVEDSVKGTQNEDVEPPVFHFTPTPWAVGVPVAYQPGNQPVPFDVTFDVDLGLSDGRVREYFQEQLSGGRVVVAVTSLFETVQFGTIPGALPNIFNKEGLNIEPGAKAPALFIELFDDWGGDVDLDCDVDLVDHRAFSRCFSGPGATPNPPPPLTTTICLSAFDLDVDSDVDLNDSWGLSPLFTGQP